MTIGQEIRAARGKRTQAEISTAAGIGKSYLCDIEKGRRFPPPVMLKQLAEALGVSPDRWLWLWVVEQMGEEDAGRAVRYSVTRGES